MINNLMPAKFVLYYSPCRENPAPQTSRRLRITNLPPVPKTILQTFFTDPAMREVRTGDAKA
jgi:hypothetical protein